MKNITRRCIRPVEAQRSKCDVRCWGAGELVVPIDGYHQPISRSRMPVISSLGRRRIQGWEMRGTGSFLITSGWDYLQRISLPLNLLLLLLSQVCHR